jgi:hypothetical protein
VFVVVARTSNASTVLFDRISARVRGRREDDEDLASGWRDDALTRAIAGGGDSKVILVADRSLESRSGAR